MTLKFKNNFLGYYQFYYSVLGNKIAINLALCVVISFLDGMGLAMFIPLLQVVGDGNAHSSDQSMGWLHFVTDGIGALGFPITLNTILLTLVVLFTIKGCIKFLQITYQVRIRQIFMRRMRYKLLNDLHDLTYEGFLTMDAGRIQNTLLSEVQRLFQTMNFYFNAAQSFVMLVTYILLAVLANYQFAILVAIGASLTNFVYRRIYASVKAASKQLSKKGNSFNSFLLQAVHNFKYLKATNYFSRFQKKLNVVIDQTEQLNRRMGRYNAITTSLREPMIISIVTIVIFLQITWMGASLSSILLSLLLFYRALSFLMVVQNYWQSFMENIGAMDAVSSFMREMEHRRETNSETPFDGFTESIRFCDVSFSYSNRKVIDRVSFSIPKNETIALVGESGSGKTTLANMISSLILPDSGDVLIDGSKLHKYDLNSYRNRVGYISQEPVIFNDSIYNNITFWAEVTEQNLERFDNILDLASLKEFIETLPDGKDTMLGDNGILISGGQKQRISIARELYKEAEILILDEATSALDSETERIIQANIEKLHGKYTMIIIAHRLSTIRNADVIYLLEDGRISAYGDFSDMMGKSERFKRMVELQDF